MNPEMQKVRGFGRAWEWISATQNRANPGRWNRIYSCWENAWL